MWLSVTINLPDTTTTNNDKVEMKTDKSLEYISQYYSKSYPGTYRLRFQNISTNCLPLVFGLWVTFELTNI